MSGPTEPSGLAERVAVVTGAARGIGRAIASALVAAGCRVALLDVDNEALAATSTELTRPGRDALALRCDVGRSPAVDTALATVRSELGTPTLLVNNAGVGGPFHRIDEVSEAEWDALMATNLKSVFLLCRGLLPGMAESGFGRVVNVASVQGLVGAARSSTYVASKHGVIGYTRALAAEWGPHGVTCNAVCPGYVATRLGVQDDSVDEHRDRVLARTPVGRVAQPGEVARTVLHLLQPQSGYINGAVISIDGGITADVGIT